MSASRKVVLSGGLTFAEWQQAYGLTLAEAAAVLRDAGINPDCMAWSATDIVTAEFILEQAVRAKFAGLTGRRRDEVPYVM